MLVIKKKYDEVTSFLIEICKKASKEILNIYNNENLLIKTKDDKSPVTAADLISNQIITEELKNKFNTYSIISEEGINRNFKKKDFFLIDPLDGTKEFIKKNDEFTINIAFLENLIPTIGVVCIPAKNVYYFSNGIESFKIDKEGKTKKITSFEKEFEEMRIVVSRSHLDLETEKILKSFKKKRIIKKGSSLKFCLIAEGKADFYCRFGNTMEWDIAAGHAILKNAKGTVVDKNFNEIMYGKKNFLNSTFFAFSKFNKLYIKKTINNYLKS